jgi:hypothetical protein
MVLMSRPRRQLFITASCAIFAISGISFLRLNSYLDIDAFGIYDENKVDEKLRGNTGYQRLNNLTEDFTGNRQNNSSIAHQTLHRHNNTHFALHQWTNNKLNITYVVGADDDEKDNPSDEAGNETDSSLWIQASRRELFEKLPRMKQFAAKQPSPACRPNLNLALPEWKWDNITKFERIYFYHSRKAYVNFCFNLQFAIVLTPYKLLRFSLSLLEEGLHWHDTSRLLQITTGWR